MDWNKYIVRDSAILVGKATIRGTRISVEMILDDLAAGCSEEQIAVNYGIEIEAVRAAVTLGDADENPVNRAS